MANDEPKTQSKRRHFGCLFLLGSAVAFALFSLYADYHVRIAVRAELERLLQEDREKQLAEVRAGYSVVNIDDAKMMQMLADDPACRENVTNICLTMTDLGDPQFRRVREFPNLKELSFYCCRNADNIMAAARDLSAIESLFFEGTSVSDETLRSFAESPNLKKLHFEQVMPDATIDELKRLFPDVEIEAYLESEEAEYRKLYDQQEVTKSE